MWAKCKKYRQTMHTFPEQHFSLLFHLEGHIPEELEQGQGDIGYLWYVMVQNSCEKNNMFLSLLI